MEIIGKTLRHKWFRVLLTGYLLGSLAGCAAPAAPTVGGASPTRPTEVAVTATALPSASATSSPTSTAVSVRPTGASTPKETPVMNAVPIPTPLDPGMEKLVTQAKEDLAKRLSLNVGQIELVSAESVTWPDGSLGCPQPGMVYTQVLVDGYRIQLRASGSLYDYHGGGTTPPFLCEHK